MSFGGFLRRLYFFAISSSICRI
uniref:Uncharacterized protein n=1 Tax=Arundo donax TaxID=35708 RepID=A0A0A9AKB4_ARUDO